MLDASDILVLGHRGLLGQALVMVTGGRCQTIEAGREAFDLAQVGQGTGRPPVGPGGGVDAQAAGESLRRLSRDLPARGAAAAEAHAGLDLVGRAIVQCRPRLVINCAGYTKVDEAEARPELALAVNGQGAQAVARACLEAGSHLIHISTDFVFDGRAQEPYREDDAPAPLSVYGRSKLLGERLVRETLPGALIVRTAWLFGPGRANFVDKVLDQAGRGESFGVVADQVGSPTYSLDLAQALVDLSQRWVGGVLHVVNSGQVSRHEMARQSLRMAGLDPGLARPITSAELGLAAARPAYSALDGRRAERAMGRPMPPWQDALGRYLALKREERL